MSEVLKIIILGIVQGVTEFLPVSSSGHLVLAGHLLGLRQGGNMTEVVLHAGTLAAILVFFRKRLAGLFSGLARRDPASVRYMLAVAAGSVPAVVLYFAAGAYIESFFEKTLWVAVFLCVTGAVLLSLLFCREGERKINMLRGFAVGLAQASALLPGISRSGSTIAAARFLGLSREDAAEFSFILFIPAMAGALLLKAIHVLKGSESIDWLSSAAGVSVSGLVGYFALTLLMSSVRKGRLWFFGVYCVAVGTVSLFFLS